MIRVLIADDHPLFRNGLKQALTQEPDLEVIGEAENSDQVLKSVETSPCDVLVLDLMMPGRGGLDVLRDIRRERPGLPILILSVHAEDQFAVRAIKAGANGYVNKETSAPEVIQAVRKVLTGKKYVSPNLAEMLANALDNGSERPAHEALSDREFR